MTLLAYRFALNPTPAQERALRSHAGAARVAFNWGLARVKANLGQREAKRKGKLAGFPRFRSRRKARPSVRFTTGAFRRQAAYKAEWRGGRVIVADRWLASSKTCAGCGAVKAKLPLSERTYACTSCGMIADRDLNAALNLAALGRRELAGSGPDSN